MNYIRTKDGIYTLSEAYWAGIEDEIIAQADTIEELCDEFVYENQEYKTPQKCCQSYSGNWHDEQSSRLLTDDEVLTVKGAIWTDKGLIYVAKMNEKGELELL